MISFTDSLQQKLLSEVLERYVRFNTRFSVQSPEHQLEIRQKWSNPTEFITQFVKQCDSCGDFNNNKVLGCTHVLMLRDGIDKNGRVVAIMQPRDDYVILNTVKDHYEIARVRDRLCGYLKIKYSNQQKALRRVRQKEPAVWVSEETGFNLPGLKTFSLSSDLEELCMLRVGLAREDEWAINNAFKRDVLKEGRIVNYGSKPGREISELSVPFHPLTEHILRLLNYPLEGTEPWRTTSVVWNRYSIGDGTAMHKNWAGLERHMYIHFGPGNCLFSFYHRGSRELAQARRIKSMLMYLGSSVNDRNFLHEINDVKGGVHYSMAVRNVTSDWQKWAELKITASGQQFWGKSRSRVSRRLALLVEQNPKLQNQQISEIAAAEIATDSEASESSEEELQIYKTADISRIRTKRSLEDHSSPPRKVINSNKLLSDTANSDGEDDYVPNMIDPNEE